MTKYGDAISQAFKRKFYYENFVFPMPLIIASMILIHLSLPPVSVRQARPASMLSLPRDLTWVATLGWNHKIKNWKFVDRRKRTWPDASYCPGTSWTASKLELAVRDLDFHILTEVIKLHVLPKLRGITILQGVVFQVIIIVTIRKCYFSENLQHGKPVSTRTSTSLFMTSRY